MDLSLAARSDPGTLLTGIIASDRAYFRLGARCETLPGAELCMIDRLAHNPAASVVQCVDPAAVAEGGAEWIAHVEARLAAAGAGFARVYLDHAGTVADAVLRAARYEPREEIAFAGDVSGDHDPSLAFSALTDEAGWARKQAFHREAADQPDGHQSSPDEWVEIERERCRNGGMQALLCARAGVPVGAFGLMATGSFLRVKNLVVAPGERRSVGMAILHQAASIARQRDLAGICLFAVAGHAGEALYRAAGLREFGRQIEWSRVLGADRR